MKALFEKIGRALWQNLLLPLLLALYGAADAFLPDALPALDLSAPELFVVGVIGFVLGRILRLIRLPGVPGLS